MRDLREYAQKTNLRLVIGSIILLCTIGVGLIAWFYGWNAAILGLTCVLGAFLPVALIAGLLFLLDWILKRGKQE